MKCNRCDVDINAELETCERITLRKERRRVVKDLNKELDIKIFKWGFKYGEHKEMLREIIDDVNDIIEEKPNE